MGLIHKVMNSRTEDKNNLNLQELEFLLFLIKNSTFKGEQIEIIYNAAIKLQQQYLQFQSKNK
jgi:uncharacterized protein Smg (DUF494 family)